MRGVSSIGHGPPGQHHPLDSPNPAPGLRQQHRHHDGEAVRIHEVVGVVILEERSARELGGPVAIAVVAEVALVDHDANARVEPLVGARDLDGPVRRAIVDDQQLEIP